MAFSRDWNEASPLGSAAANTLDDIIRNGEVDISDRLKNMIYGFIAGENTLAQHFQYLQFYEQASIAQPSAGFGRLGCKAVSDKCELFWHDEDGDEIQLTTGGKWNGAVLLAESIPAGSYAADSIDEDDIQLANDAHLTAKDAAGTGTVDLLKAGTNDLPTLPDSAEMASNAAPVEDEAIVNKKYVDDQITGQASKQVKAWVKFDGSGANGAVTPDDSYNVSGINKDSTGTYTISWDTNFGSADYVVVGTSHLYDASTVRIVTIESMAAGNVVIRTCDHSSAIADADLICIMAIGDQ